MGERTVMQEPLFYSFSLENHVSADHGPDRDEAPKARSAGTAAH